MSTNKKYIYRQVNLMKKTMEERFREELKVADLLRASNFTNYHFIKIFKSVCGMSPEHYLAQLKISGVKQELIHTNQPVSEISEMFGFSDQRSFTRTFIRFTGQNPDQYRRLHQTIVNGRSIDDQIEDIIAFAGRQVAGFFGYQSMPSVAYH